MADKLKAGQRAPDFTLPTVSGGRVGLRELAGKNTLLIFWKSTCPYCVKEAPGLSEIVKASSGDVQIVAINTGRDTVQDAQRFAQESGFPFTVAVDEDKSARTAYGLKIVPTLFWVGSDGTIQAVYEGSSPGLQDAVRKALEAVNNGQPVPAYDVVGSG